MDAPLEIKARLPIEELVGSYCQLQKKGRNFICLCPFHSDTRPSFLVSPDKGIAYCFACQTGGDIFSFYQAIEGVDFRQALKDLAERTGVHLEERAGPVAPKKDEKERVRDCLKAASQFYSEQLKQSESARKYLADRGVKDEEIEKFQLGVAPDSFSSTYEHLLKQGFSRKEILDSGLGVQRELQQEKIYDRFRHRLMFPIFDHQGAIIGFGGRTLGQDDAKYINSSESILYHKSNVLFGIHHAKEAMRETHKVMVVEGYFDVLACHRVGMHNVIAPCGTALTEEQVKLLKRYVDTVILCFDQDQAGRAAAERAFMILSKEGVTAEAMVLPDKDPADVYVHSPDLLMQLLRRQPQPYMELVLEQILSTGLETAQSKREAFDRLVPLLASVRLGIERHHYMEKAGKLLGAMGSDLDQAVSAGSVRPTLPVKKAQPVEAREEFSSMEIALSIFLHYPQLRPLLDELIPPDDGFAHALYLALKSAPDVQPFTPDLLTLPDEHRERANILWLFGEHHGFTEWNDTFAAREIRKNCISANREFLRTKQQQITKRLLAAHAGGDMAEEAQLSAQYQQLLKLMKKAS